MFAGGQNGNISKKWVNDGDEGESYHTKQLSVCFQFVVKQFNPLSVNPKKWSNTLKQFIGNFPANCLSMFDHFVGFVLKRFI